MHAWIICIQFTCRLCDIVMYCERKKLTERLVECIPRNYYFSELLRMNVSSSEQIMKYFLLPWGQKWKFEYKVTQSLQGRWFNLPQCCWPLKSQMKFQQAFCIVSRFGAKMKSSENDHVHVYVPFNIVFFIKLIVVSFIFSWSFLILLLSCLP